MLYSKILRSSEFHLQVSWGQVERDAALDLLAVLEVAEEAEPDVEVGDEAHARVEDAVVAQHVSRMLHLKWCS